MTDQPALYRSCVTTLGEMVDSDASLHDVERAIDALALSSDEQSALWLWATARVGRANCRDGDVLGMPTPDRRLLDDQPLWPGG